VKLELDKVIHQPIRTQILAMLINEGPTDYSSIKKRLELSDGHMTTHMKELTSSGYVVNEKEFVNNKPKTTYKITREGKKRFAEYVDILKKLIMSK
jgi:predicted ArsR family transcriptional regulator